MRAKTPLLQFLANCLRKASGIEQAEAVGKGTTRRKFLKTTSSITIGTTLVSGMESCAKAGINVLAAGQMAARRSTAQPSIAIVGAGIAGLYAAWLLKQKNYTCSIFEGSSRTGGRMFTKQNIMGAGLYTEVGGEFIDSSHADMLYLARIFGLELLDTKLPPQSPLQHQAYFFNNRHYTEAEVVDAFRPYIPAIKSDQHGMSSIITAESHTAFDAMLDNLSIAQYFDRIGLQGWLREMLDVAYVTEYGQPIAEQTSLNFLWLIKPTVAGGKFDPFGDSDERYKVKGGNQLITDRLTAELNSSISLQHKLIGIQNTGGGIVLSFDTPAGAIQKTFDYVLMTIPFTTLRAVAVSPAWPEWKRKAIFDIGYGYNSKMMLGFSQRYWNNLGYAGYFFTDSFLQSGWDNSQLQQSTHGALTVYSGGAQALAIGNDTIATQAQLHLQKLEELYPGATEYHNGIADRFIWPSNPWVQASYTCFKPGQYTTIAGYEKVSIGNLFFAGEHCSYDFQGFMNGGAETGRSAAEEIMRRMEH